MKKLSLPLLLLISCAWMTAEEATVRGSVKIVHNSKRQAGNSDAVIWLTAEHSNEIPAAGRPTRLLQKNKTFIPHVTAITIGTRVEVPNQDPFFHDAFSIYQGKPFNLGLYEAGAVRTVRFSQPGISYIFCNIHPEMSAVVITLSTRHFARTKPDGSFEIRQVPPGKYKLRVWYELASQGELDSLTRDVDLTQGDNALQPLTLTSSDVTIEHLNKYGEAYVSEKPVRY